jgi:hypothetical protein
MKGRSFIVNIPSGSEVVVAKPLMENDVTDMVPALKGPPDATQVKAVLELTVTDEQVGVGPD